MDHIGQLNIPCLALRIAVLVALAMLCGCVGTAGLGAGLLSGGLTAATTGGPITPITNLSSALILQEAQEIHNLYVGLSAIYGAALPVTVVNPPSTVVVPTPPSGGIPTGPTPKG